MKLLIGGVDVTQLAVEVQTSGSGKECSRTLKAGIVQSPTDANLPTVPLKIGMPAVLQDEGQYFVGMLLKTERSTAGSTITVTAKDLGIYANKNKVSHKVTKLTPEAAAADLCALYGVPVGRLAQTGFVFSRIYTGATLYAAIMTGYTLAAAENGKKYMMIMEGTALSVVERGEYIAAVIREGENLMEATYSESIENLINQVDIFDKKGKLVQSVMGDTSFGIMRDQVTLTDSEDGVAKAEKIIRDNGVAQTATIKSIGGSGCTSGNAVLVYEPFTGLWGKFWIASDTHAWKNGIYTNSLTLAFENSMDSQEAGKAITEKKRGSGGGTDVNKYIGYHGETLMGVIE